MPQKICPNCSTMSETDSLTCPNCKKNYVKKKGGCLKTIGIGFAVLFGLVFIINVANPNKNRARNAQQKTEQTAAVKAINVNAEQLLSDYEANELSADGKYKGKLANVTGIVKSIEKMMGQSFVTLGTGKQFELLSVQCFFSQNNENDLAQLSKGQTVTFQCTLDGKSMNIHANNCSLK